MFTDDEDSDVGEDMELLTQINPDDDFHLWDKLSNTLLEVIDRYDVTVYASDKSHNTSEHSLHVLDQAFSLTSQILVRSRGLVEDHRNLVIASNNLLYGLEGEEARDESLRIYRSLTAIPKKSRTPHEHVGRAYILFHAAECDKINALALRQQAYHVALKCPQNAAYDSEDAFMLGKLLFTGAVEFEEDHLELHKVLSSAHLYMSRFVQEEPDIENLCSHAEVLLELGNISDGEEARQSYHEGRKSAIRALRGGDTKIGRNLKKELEIEICYWEKQHS